MRMESEATANRLGDSPGGSSPPLSAKFCCDVYEQIYGMYHPPVICQYRNMKEERHKLLFCPFCGESVKCS